MAVDLDCALAGRNEEPGATELITPGNVDLSNCDREQVQYAGAILDHGVLLTVSEPNLTVLQASINCGELLGVPVNELLGRPLTAILKVEEIELVRQHIARGIPSQPVFLFALTRATRAFDVFCHRHGGVVIFEFETRAAERLESPHLYSEVRATLNALDAAPDLQSFFDVAVSRIRELTGFDRVLAYKFQPDGSGWVRSESLDESTSQPPYLGLHYPASDIPQPARRILALSWLRHQPDIGYTPVPIVPAINPATGAPLDMTYALLRSVSPMYSQYLKNMGTHSSMVMTLLKDGNLWGLIACHHHRGPRHVPLEVRMACEFLAHDISLLMSAKEEKGSYEYKIKLKSVEAALANSLCWEDKAAFTSAQKVPLLLDFIHCTGATRTIGEQVSKFGSTPTDDQILALTAWLSEKVDSDIFATDSLSAEMPAAEEFKDAACGLLAVRLSRMKNDYLMWFRGELIQTVNWAGDPQKPVDTADQGQRLVPRVSFAIWKHTVRLKSESWLDLEIAAASDLRTHIVDLMLIKADEMGRLYEDLERSYAELDAFTYIASNDLKEQLQGISDYSGRLSEDYASKLDAEGQQRLDAIGRLSSRMHELLESLLEYCRVGRNELAEVTVDMNAVLAEAVDILRSRLVEQKTEIRVPASLPHVQGDYNHLAEVLIKLIGNATKYNDKDTRWVEIGANAAIAGEPITFYVRDNGIGIEPEQCERIFGIFHRLHTRDAFGGGAGAGLTIAKKIVERHGGKIWVESIPGKESTFRFTLRPDVALATRPGEPLA